VPGIGFVLVLVPGFLALKIDRVLLEICLEDVVGTHPEDLGQANQKVEQVDHLDPGVLLIELLVLGLLLPGYAVG
jgi:hypothetical protein